MAPLAASLAHALLDINVAFDRSGDEADDRPSLVLWADLLRVVPDAGIPLGDLPAAARVSRRSLRIGRRDAMLRR